MAICQGHSDPGRQQENDDNERGKRQAQGYDSGVAVAAMNEGICQREQDSDGVANHAGPSGLIDLSAACNVEHEGDGGQPAMIRPAVISQIENLSQSTSGTCQ